jgi:hypothetical protein
MERSTKFEKVVRVCSVASAVALLVLSASSAALASTSVRAPEIDGSSVSVGLGVLAASALILRARFRK